MSRNDRRWRSASEQRLDRRLVLLAMGFAMTGSTAANAQSDAGRALRDAAASGRSEEVKKLLATPQGKAAIDAADASGQTALLLAVARGQDAAAIALIDAGADINAQAQNHDSPWLLAGARGQTAMLRAMLATGKVDYSRRNRFGGNALIPACERGHVDTVRVLVTESKIDVDHVNNLGWTALLEAVILGDGGERHVEIVRLLIAAKANVNLADRDGVTPLMHARQKRQTRVIALLEQAGAR